MVSVFGIDPHLSGLQESLGVCCLKAEGSREDARIEIFEKSTAKNSKEIHIWQLLKIAIDSEFPWISHEKNVIR